MADAQTLDHAPAEGVACRELPRLFAAGWAVRSPAERLKISEAAVYIAMRKAEADGTPMVWYLDGPSQAQS